MLTLDQLISEATALPDTAKAILFDKILESMTEQIDQEVLNEGYRKLKTALPRLIVAQSNPFQAMLAWHKFDNY
ncbi:hypothetical protein [Microcoleus sp. herbarium5]|uniref:hypothetical protein n=1 Tax=Microcoleus sp. herbarium5 TaxID=3055434 RepID=UPI002FD23A9C